MRFHFGDCVLDTGTRELTRSGRSQPLQPKGLQLLELLVENRPRALGKPEIHDRLWPSTFVSDSSLARLVTELRAAIGDSARKPRFIRTVHRFGYAFSGPIEPEAPELAPKGGASRFHLTWGARTLPVPEGETVLGRAEDAAVWIDSTKVSRHHARIVVSNGSALLEDLKSKNGTYVRGRRVEGPTSLADGDEICIGPVLLIFHATGAPSTETDLPR